MELTVGAPVFGAPVLSIIHDAPRRRRRHEAETKLVTVEAAVLKWGRALAASEQRLERAEHRMRRGGFRSWSGAAERALDLRAAVDRARRLLVRAQLQRRRLEPIASLARRAEAVRAAAIRHKEARRRDPGEGKRIRARLVFLEEARADREHPVDAVTLQKVAVPQFVASTASLRFSGSLGRAALLREIDADAEPEDFGDAGLENFRIVRRQNGCATPFVVAERDVAISLPTRPSSCWAVHLQISDGFRCLIRVPIRTAPPQFGSSWPEYLRQFSDHVGALDAGDAQQHAVARLRALGPPMKFEVERMELALGWPTDYLANDEAAARAVGRMGIWAALERPPLSELQTRGISAPEFFRDCSAGSK